MSDRTLKGLIGLVLAGLVAVIGAGAFVGSSAVAGDLRDRARTALSAAGLDGIGVDFDGREAELKGGNDVEIRRAETLVAALPGVRGVRADVTRTRSIAGVARFELDRAGDDVEISGVVPTPDHAADIKIAVAQGLRTVITGDLTIDRSLSGVSWIAALPDAFEALAGVRSLELDIPGDGTVEVGGRVEDASERSRLARRVAEVFPDLDVVSTLVVAPTRTEG